MEWRAVLNGNLISALKKNAVHCPDKLAYIVLEDGEKESKKISYSELDKKAHSIAAFLQQNQLTGERVLLPFPAGLEFIVAFMGCLYAGAIAVPVVYPNKYNFHQSAPFIKTIIQDCAAKAILSTADFLLFRDAFELSQSFLVADISALEEKYVESYLPCNISPNTITHLQYTSGSTSTPKGVITTHANLTHTLYHTIRAWGYSQDSITLTWAAHTHVYGLIAGLLMPLFHGTPSIIMPSVVFIARPIRWFWAISKYHVTHSGCPNFGYELCLSQINEEELKNVDLRSWKVAISGGETVQARTLKEFSEKFGPHGFCPQSFCPAYGMSETTGLIACNSLGKQPTFYHLDARALNENLVSVSEHYNEQSRTIVSCGFPLEGIRVTIRDVETQKEVGAEHIGEIWLSGSPCSPGYWDNKNSDLRRTDFSMNLSDNIIKTGDLGFIKNGEIILTGRLKEMIIIFGKNYYPIDIERTASNSYPLLRYKNNVAFSIQQESKEKVVLIQEVDDSLTHTAYQELQQLIRKAIATQHGIEINDIVFVAIDSIPKTINGKMQRILSRQYYVNQNFKRLYWDDKELHSMHRQSTFVSL